MSKLSIITITYNNESNISGYIENIFRFSPPDCEIIILDNNSTDQTVNIINKFTKIKLIEQKENLGFSKGNNQAVQSAIGEYLLFLNPDSRLMGDCIKDLIWFSDQHANIGIVAPKLIEANKETQASVRKLPTIIGAVKEYYLNIPHSYEAYVPTEVEPVEIESVVGAAILMKRKLFLEIGGFNEKYFMYYEDLDLCRKVSKRNLKIYYYPECCIEHQVGGSISEKKVGWLETSAWTYHGVLIYTILSLLLRFRPRRKNNQ